MFKKLLSKITGKKEPKKITNRKKKVSKGKRKASSKEDYENRFQKFYHLNKKRLNNERRGSYKTRAKKGTCVRCKRKSLPGIVFCDYHKKKQKEYNAKARSKKKVSKKKK